MQNYVDSKYVQPRFVLSANREVQGPCIFRYAVGKSDNTYDRERTTRIFHIWLDGAKGNRGKF